MNRCSTCGRFRAWEDLEAWERCDLTIVGTVVCESGFFCSAPCREAS